MRHLTALLCKALRHVFETYTEAGSMSNRPGPTEFAEYRTAAFVEAVRANDEGLSPPGLFTTAPGDQAPAGDDPAGGDGPMLGDPSARLDRGAFPKEAFCIRAFGLMEFALSPFAHYETIPKEAMEDWARAP